MLPCQGRPFNHRSHPSQQESELRRFHEWKSNGPSDSISLKQEGSRHHRSMKYQAISAVLLFFSGISLHTLCANSTRETAETAGFKLVASQREGGRHEFSEVMSALEVKIVVQLDRHAPDHIESEFRGSRAPVRGLS